MKRILPTEKFTITTHLTPDKVEDKLSNYVEPYKLIRFNLPFAPPPDKPYEGKVENGIFKIQKISRYKKKNALPIVEGRVSPQDRGSLIDITIKPNKFLNDFMSLFPFFATPVAVINILPILLSSQNNANSDLIMICIPQFLVGIAYFINVKSFKSDLQEDKKFLLEIFK